MDPISTQESDSIRAAARKFIRQRAPVAHLRALREADDKVAPSRALWREMAALGFAGWVVPERYGGSGRTYRELGPVVEELGRNLVPTPLLSTVLAGGVVLLAGTEAQREAMLPALCAGERVTALAHEEGRRHAPYQVATRAIADAHGFVLQGEKSFVIDGYGADDYLVVARTSGHPGESAGLTLFHLPAGAPGVSVQRLDTVDTRNAARLRLDAVRVDERARIGAIDGAGGLLDCVLSRATAVLAAEMLGGLQEAFDRTIAYLKTRKQFGVYIGSFQALKHRAAWMFCEAQLTRSLVYEALEAIDSDRKDALVLASAAKARASDTFVLVANEAVQMHGGIGVTDELDIGLYLKRARVAEQTLGGAPYHRDRFAKLRGY